MSFCPETKVEAEAFIGTVRREWRKTGKSLPSRSWGPTQASLFIENGGAALLRTLVADSGVTFDEAKALVERFWEMYRLEILEGVPSDKRFWTDAKMPLVFDRLLSELKANKKIFEENRFDATHLVSTTLYYGKLSRSELSFSPFLPDLAEQGAREDDVCAFIDGIRKKHVGKTIYGMRSSPEVIAFMDSEGRRILSGLGAMTEAQFKNASQLLDSFDKMCRRQDASMPSGVGYAAILRHLVFEHDENIKAVQAGMVRSGELVFVTAYHGAIGRRIVEQIPSLKGSSILKQALYHRACDPWAFLEKRGCSSFSSAPLLEKEDVEAFIARVRLARKAKNVQTLRNSLGLEEMMNGVPAERLAALTHGTSIQQKDLKLLMGRFLSMCSYQGAAHLFSPEASLGLLTQLVSELRENLEALDGTFVRPEQLVSATLYHGAIGARLVDSDPSLKGTFLLKKVLVRHAVDLRGLEGKAEVLIQRTEQPEGRCFLLRDEPVRNACAKRPSTAEKRQRQNVQPNQNIA